MPYATPLDVVARWPKIHTANLSHDELRVLIDDADAIINARLATRYAVPITSEPSAAPPLLRQISATFALLDVFDRMKERPEWITARLERMDALLGDLASGDLALPGADGALVTESSADLPLSATTDYVPVFGAVPSLTEGYDATRAEAERGARGLVTDGDG